MDSNIKHGVQEGFLSCVLPETLTITHVGRPFLVSTLVGDAVTADRGGSQQ